MLTIEIVQDTPPPNKQWPRRCLTAPTRATKPRAPGTARPPCSRSFHGVFTGVQMVQIGMFWHGFPGSLVGRAGCAFRAGFFRSLIGNRVPTAKTVSQTDRFPLKEPLFEFATGHHGVRVRARWTPPGGQIQFLLVSVNRQCRGQGHYQYHTDPETGATSRAARALSRSDTHNISQRRSSGSAQLSRSSRSSQPSQPC